MVLFLCCVSSSSSSVTPHLAIEPLSLERRQAQSLARPRPPAVEFGTQKGKVLAWLATEQRIGPVEPADEVLTELGNRKAFQTETLDMHNDTALARNGLNEDILDQLGPETDFATYASLLRRCTSAKALSEGKQVHAHMSKRGYARNRFLSNLLVQMYSKCGNLQYARAVFDTIGCPNLFSWNIMIAACAQNGSLDDVRAVFAEMSQRNVISWSVMISAYAHNGQGKEALQLFVQMQAEGFEPDKVTFMCVVDACASVAALEDGRMIHSVVNGNGWESDAVVGTALVNMYGKCGGLDDAQAVFAEMAQRDAVAWSTMIAVCAHNGHDKEALQLFGQMHAEGFQPNKISFLSVVDVVALEEGQVIHAIIAGNGLESDNVVGTALLNMYGKCGSLDDARAVFAEMLQWDVVSWTAMIATCGNNGHGMEALQMFGQMQAEGFKPDKITFICILDACACLAALEEGQAIHAKIASNGWESDVVLGNALVNMYGKCADPVDASAVFEGMPQRNVVSWSAMISVCTQNGHGKEALHMFSEMQAKRCEADEITFICVVDACASVGALEEGRVIHASAVGYGLESDIVMGNALGNMYGKCSMLDDARAVFAEMPQWNMVSWNAMIAACAQNGHGKEALQMFGQMQTKGFEADNISFICIVDACASVAALEEGLMFHSIVAGKGFDSDVVLGNALINMYGKCGNLDDAITVLEDMPQRNVVSWSVLISVCAQNGHGKEALQLFGQMQAEGLEPNTITLTSILTACSHTGQIVDGRRYFASMKKDHGITPSMEHYLCMIDLLGRRGLLEEAENLIISMPFEHVTPAWLSLLSSCRLHNDVERAERASNFVFKLDPRNALPHVLLTDIRANVGQLEDVVPLRRVMIDKG